MRRRLSYLGIACYLAVLSQPAPVLASSAVSVPREARETVTAAVAAAQEILDKEQEARERAEALLDVQQAESEVAEAKLLVGEAEKDLARSAVEAEEATAEAQRATEDAQQARARAAALTKEAEQAAQAAEIATADAEAIEASLQAEDDALTAKQNAQSQPVPVDTVAPVVQTSSFEDTDELLSSEKEMKQLEQAQKDGELARRKNIPAIAVSEEPLVDWSGADAAYAYAKRLERIAEEADKTAEHADNIADQKIACAEEAASKAADKKQAVLDAELAVTDAKETAAQAEVYAIQTKAQLEQLIYSQDHPKGVHTFSSELNYYSGKHAYQLTQPISFSYWQQEISYALNTKYVVSKNNADDAKGQINTLADTTLTVAKRQTTPQYILDYSLGINIPTGKSALSWSERNARLNEDLFEVSELGKGWQFTPEIAVSWEKGKEDMWTIGTSYAFCGSYDPSSDIPDDNISPGNEWRKFIRWQHAGQDWQFVGELSNTSTGITKIANGDSYTNGDQWEYRLTYNKKISDAQNIMFYYWRDNQDINSIVPSDSSNAMAHYMGTMWSKKLDAKHTLRVSFDVMDTDGKRYDRIYNYYDAGGNPQYTSVDVNGRTKYTLGVGYDISLDSQSNLSIDLQRFIMKDGESSLGQTPTTYSGFNVFFKYIKNI